MVYVEIALLFISAIKIYLRKRNVETEEISVSEPAVEESKNMNEMDPRFEVDTEISDKYKTRLVDLDHRFKNLDGGAELYSADDIHPTVKGHKLIADEWLKVCGDILK